MISKSEVKYIQSLAHKKQRELNGQFILEGIKIINELLSERKEWLRKVFATETWLNSNASRIPEGIEVMAVSEEELSRISLLSTPNQVLCIAAIPEPVGMPKIDSGLWLLLDAIRDPGNLGTIIRSAEWFGVKGIICSEDTVDAFNPKVIQSAMGSILRMPLSYLSLESFLSFNQHTQLYRAVMDGSSLYKAELQLPCMLMIGNEANGISERLLKTIGIDITIPTKNRADSLNAAVAASVILSEFNRRFS